MCKSSDVALIMGAGVAFEYSAGRTGRDTMRTLLVLSVLAFLFTAGTVAMAAEWTGTQMMVGADASAVLWSSDRCYYPTPGAPEDTLSVTGNVTYYDCSKSDSGPIYFAYAGVKRTVGTFYIHPRIGYAGGWFKDDAGIGALEVGGPFELGFGGPSLKVDWSLDEEYIFDRHLQTWYTFAQVTRKVGVFTFGVHAEGNDMHWQFGPSVKYDGFKIAGYGGEGRFATRISFTL